MTNERRADVQCYTIPNTFWMLIKALFSWKRGRFQADEFGRYSASISSCVHDGLSQYCELTGFSNNGFLPITWPHILSGPLHLAIATHSQFPLPAMGLIHLRNRIVAHRPIAVDESLDITCFIDGHRTVAIGIEFDLMTHITVGGICVWESSTTILSRAVPGDGRQRTKWAPSVGLYQRILKWSLPVSLGRDYASISKDYNPIHMYGWSAKLFGFSRPIAHGMCLLAKTANAIWTERPYPIVLTSIFRKPILLPCSTALERLDIEGKSHYQVVAKNGKVHIFGTIGPLE
jgi:hypothetical protein